MGPRPRCSVLEVTNQRGRHAQRSDLVAERVLNEYTDSDSRSVGILLPDEKLPVIGHEVEYAPSREGSTSIVGVGI